MAVLMAMSVFVSVQAQDKKPENRPNREELREKFQNLSPEERAAKAKEFREKNPEASAKMEERRDQMLKDLGLSAEEFKKLSESERRAKIAEATTKKLAELQKKKKDGTLTDSEKTMLERMEQRKKAMEQNPGQRGEGKRPGKPGAEKKSSDK